MKKNISLALLAVLFLFANSCHDEVGVDSELTLKSVKLKKDVVTEMKLWFDSNPDVNKFVLLEYADEVKWASAQVMEIDNSIVTEVQVKLKEKHIVMSEKDPTLNFEHRLLFIHKAGEITSYMEYFISKKDIGYLHDTEKTSYLKMDGSFEGSIVLENNKGKSSVIYHSTGNSQELRLKNVAPVCYELVQIFTDGSYRVVAQLGCSGGNSTPTGTAGSSHPSTNPAPTPAPDPNIPCAGDPIKNATIASSGASGQYGGTYGCVRQGGTTCSDGIYNKKHGGLDIYAKENSDLYSISSGKVSYVGYITDLGNCIQITSSDNSTSILYAHLNSQSLAVGNDVKIGDKLGLTGKTGNASDPAIIPHVHIQIKVNGVATDPQPFLSTTFNSDGSVSVPCNN